MNGLMSQSSVPRTAHLPLKIANECIVCFRNGEIVDQIQDKTDNVEVLIDGQGETIDDYRDLGN